VCWEKVLIESTREILKVKEGSLEPEALWPPRPARRTLFLLYTEKQAGIYMTTSSEQTAH
jgi:hypothetical protein